MSKRAYKKKAATSRDEKNFPAALAVLIVGIIAFMVWAPFQAGLFNGLILDFEKPIYWAILVGSLLLLVWNVSFFKSIKLDDQRDWTSIFVLLLPLTYIISLISAASQYFATNMVMIQCLYAFLFIMGLYTLQNKTANRWMESAIIAVGYLIVFFGLFNWLGQGKTVSALVGWFSGTVVNGQYTQAVWIDSNGPRLASVFQYPNTYAAFLIAFFFVAVFAITRSKKWYEQAIHAFMLVPIALSILLTLSRGGLVFVPVVFIVLLLFLKPAKQLLWIVYCLIAGIGTLAISKPVTNLGQQFHLGQIGDPAKGWLYVIGVSLVIALIAWLTQRYVAPHLERFSSNWAQKKLASLWLPMASVVAVGVLVALFLGTNLKHILPGNIGQRLENINMQQHSFLERMTFYIDAVKVIKDYPIIGAGGGAWASIYEKYQNNPYTSRQAHSFVMQYLVEVGILGFIIFLAFILFIFYKYIRGYMKAGEQDREAHFVYFIIVFSILVHSLMDFNMSYVFIGMLVFLGLGGMAAAMEHRQLVKIKMKPGIMRGLYSSVLILASLILIFISIRYIEVNQNIVKAKTLMSTSNNFQEIKAPLDKALKMRSDHPDAVLNMSVLLQAGFEQTKDAAFYSEEYDLLTTALKKEPYNKNMYKQLIKLYEAKGEYDKAYAVQKDNAFRYAWDMGWYEKLIVQSYELGKQNAANGRAYYDAGLAAYQHVVDGVAHLKTLPAGQMQGNPFEITQPMVLNAGKIQYSLNGPAKAVDIFKQGIRDDLNDTTNREIARWYLAALQKTGGSDQALYNQLIHLDPSEKDSIQQIVNQQP